MAYLGITSNHALYCEPLLTLQKRRKKVNCKSKKLHIAAQNSYFGDSIERQLHR